MSVLILLFFFFQAEDGIRDKLVTGVQTCALPISVKSRDPRNVFRNKRPNVSRARGGDREQRIRHGRGASQGCKRFKKRSRPDLASAAAASRVARVTRLNCAPDPSE